MKSATSAMMTKTQLEALALHRRGRFAEAIGILDRATTAHDAQSLLLRARLSIPMSPSGALLTLRDECFADCSLRERAEAMLLRGRAYARLGDFSSAEQCCASARACFADSGLYDRDLFLEIELAIGSMMIAQSRVDEADVVASRLGNQEHSTHAAAISVLLGQIAWRRAKLDETGGYLLQALRAISADPCPDVRLWAETLRLLASVLQFVPSTAVREAVAHNVAALPWTEELDDLRAQVYRLLGSRAILDGETIEGLALYKCASNVPSASIFTRIAAILNRAEVTKCLGERLFFEDQLSEATALAKQVDWQNAVPLERQALLVLAQMHAARDGALALSFAAHFEALGGFGIHNAAHPGAIAMRGYCLGIVYAENGDKSEGLKMLEGAYIEFSRFRYDWAAGMAAIALAEMTTSAAWRARARGCLAKYPNSYLSKRLASLDQVSGAVTRDLTLLTPAQLHVYHRLLENVPVKVVAASLNRSEHTVRNHIQAIFRKLGATSRNDLIKGQWGTGP